MPRSLAKPCKPPVTLFSSRDAPPGKEIEYWHDVVCEKVLELNFKALEERRFQGEFSVMPVGDLTVGNFRFSPLVGKRHGASVSNAGDTSAMLCFPLSGATENEVGTRRLLLPAGSGAIFRENRSYIVTNRTAIHMITLQIPEGAIAGGTTVLERVAYRDLARSSELFPLVRGYVERLATLTSDLSADMASRVGRNLADLVNAMVAEVAQQSPVCLSEYKALALMRVHMFVEEYLACPDLNPQMVSSALRLTQRYMNKLLAAEGTSLGRLIRDRRLERIAADLRDPALAMRNISMIAMANGFTDQCHFSKTFRQRYAMSPRQYRAENPGVALTSSA